MNQKPNILLLHVDQQRYDSLGFTGHPLVKTPNLDRLRSKGMSFEKAFTPIPLCCPARQTLLSSLMPEVHGGLWNYDSQIMTGLSPSVTTWTWLLKQEGYVNAYLGKWHVSPIHDPTAFGYDFYRSDFHYDQGSTQVMHTVSENAVWPHAGKYCTLPYEKAPVHLLADAAIEKIREYAKGDKPWHVRVDWSEPHLPCWPSEPYASMYDPASIKPWGNFTESFANKPFIQKQQLKNWNIQNWTWEDWSKYLAHYFGIISQVDDAVGKVLRALEELKLEDETVVVFTTDHGDAAGSHRMMDKHYVMYEEEVRVPLVVRWPGHVEAGTTCRDFVSSHLDLGPTLLDLIGTDIPKSFQGRSFKSGLLGQKSANGREIIFSSYHGQQFGLYDMRMIRDDRYKYVFNPTDVDEIYDLEKDPDEMVNLAGTETGKMIATRMRPLVYKTFLELGDKLMANPWMKHRLLHLI